jgi:uncharacterized protein YndB with AHSA1/START domain
MPTQEVAPLEATIEIDAPVAQVWALVSDLRNMSRWSPQVVRTFVRGGGEPTVGTRLFNINRRKLLFWPTQAKIVRFTPEKEIAFRIKENFVVWSYELEATPSGTRVVARREAPHGVSDLSVGLTKAALGGVEPFTRELVEGMNETLQRIKADAER